MAIDWEKSRIAVRGKGDRVVQLYPADLIANFGLCNEQTFSRFSIQAGSGHTTGGVSIGGSV